MDAAFLTALRAFIAEDQSDQAAERLDRIFRGTSLPQRCHELALICYQPGRRRIVIVRRQRDGVPRPSTVARRAAVHPRHGEFDWTDPARVRIQLDFVEEPPFPVNLRNAGRTGRGDHYFEMGIDGLVIREAGRSLYFFPGDAFVRSILTMKQLRRYLERATPDWPRRAVEAWKFRSRSFLGLEDRWLHLYRGYPVLPPATARAVRDAVELALSHVRRYQGSDGRFLYYYDAATDSHRDHEHPGRDPARNPYYNILRHCGGIISCLAHYRLTGQGTSRDAASLGIEYLRSQLHPYRAEPFGDAACVYYNRKAKLGGSGLALMALVQYEEATGDNRYRAEARRLKNHLLAQVTPSGEFIYYSVYLDRPVGPQDNPAHFNFYYPGEALSGLAAYYRVLAGPEERAGLADAIARALGFLLEVRPQRYAEHYESLPSDAWLMMATKELYGTPELWRPEYGAFVHADAERMLERMYREEDAPYPDYVGGFFYEYGDFPYADGARCEGLMAAAELAEMEGDRERLDVYLEALWKAAWATLHLVNTPESTYSVPRPEKAVGGIRFKHTRQWFRIDTIQHVVCFYMRLYALCRRVGTGSAEDETARALAPD